MQNLVIPNKDNRVVFVFGGVDLTLATDIIVSFGSETYSLADPEVEVFSATELSLDLSSTSEVGKIYATVTYFDSGSVNGTDITSRSLGNADQIVVAIGSQLVIEDGSGVAGANSYVTDDEYKAYCDLNGYSIPATQPDREANLARAYNYLSQTYESRLQAWRTHDEQTGCFPRDGMVVYNRVVDENIIPEDIKQAQILAAINIFEGASTNAVKTSADLKSFEVVGVYKEEYQDSSSTPTIPSMPAVTRILAPYTKTAAGVGLNRESMGYLY